MTPTEQDKELRDKLKGLDVEFLHGVPVKLPEKTIDHIMKLITADRKRVALEARADEISTIPLEHGNRTTCTYINGERQTIESRYDELKAQQGEV